MKPVGISEAAPEAASASRDSLTITRDLTPGGSVTVLASGAVVAMLGGCLGRLVRVSGDVVMARMLGPELFGLYAIGWTVARILSGIAVLGLDAGVIYYASLYLRGDVPRLKGVLLEAIGLSSLAGLAMGGGLALGAPIISIRLLAKPGLVPLLRVLGVSVGLAAALSVTTAATRVSHNVIYTVCSEGLVQPLANLVLFLCFYSAGGRLLGAAAALTLSYALGFAAAVYFLVVLVPALIRGEVRAKFSTATLLRFSLPASAASIFLFLSTVSDRLLLGYYRSSAEVGTYQAAAQLSFIFSAIQAAINTIFGPMIADLYAHNRIEQLAELFKVNTKWVLYLSLPLFLTILFVPRDLMTVLFGPAYAGGYRAAVVLSCGQFINAATGAVGFLMVMSGRQVKWAWIALFGLLADVLLNIWLIPRWGLMGAAMSTSITVSATFLTALIWIRRALGVWPYDRRYLKGFAGAGLAACLIILAGNGIGVSSMARLLETSTILIGAFAAVLIGLGTDPEDRELAQVILRRLRK